MPFDQRTAPPVVNNEIDVFVAKISSGMNQDFCDQVFREMLRAMPYPKLSEAEIAEALQYAHEAAGI